MAHNIFYLICIIWTFQLNAQDSVYFEEESIDLSSSESINFENFKQIQTLFAENEIFKWNGERHLKNNCEDRANGICILLDSWQIPNYKVWIFNGRILKKGRGTLKYGDYSWKYHVAAVVPVEKDGNLEFYVIDPATTGTNNFTAEEWAENITNSPNSYYLFSKGEKYIFTKKKRRFNKNTFSIRNNANYEFTIQGIAGFNGLLRKHRREMRTQEGIEKVQKTKTEFEKMKSTKPSFL